MGEKIKKGMNRLFIVLFALWVAYWVFYLPWNEYKTLTGNYDYWIESAQKEYKLSMDPKYEELIAKYEKEKSLIIFKDVYSKYKTKLFSDKRSAIVKVIGIPVGVYMAFLLLLNIFAWIYKGFKGENSEDDNLN